MDNQRFMTSTGQDFSWPTPEPSPDKEATEGARKHNPHSIQSFRYAVLPSGNTINVTAVDGVDGFNALRTDEVPLQTGNSTQRAIYTGKPQVEWQRGNTSRYGLAQQPWVGKSRGSTGIVPTIVQRDMDHTATLTTNERVFRSPMTSPCERLTTARNKFMYNVNGSNVNHVKHVFDDDARTAVMTWIKSAPIDKAEAVLQMIEDVSIKMQEKNLSRPGPRIVGQMRRRTSLPEIHSL